MNLEGPFEDGTPGQKIRIEPFMSLLQFIHAHFPGPKGDMFHVIHIPIVGQYSVLPLQPFAERSTWVGSQNGKDGFIDLCFITEIQNPFEAILRIVVIARG